MSTPIEKLANWLGNKPYTKAMFISAIASCVMAVMSAVMCLTLVQNRQSFELANRQILATLTPSLEMSFSTEGKMTMTLENVGVPDISDLKVYPILYRFDENNVLMDRKIKSGPVFAVQSLRSGERIEIPRDKYFDTEFVESLPIQEPGKSFGFEGFVHRVLCLAVVFRRSVDKRQFIHLEPMRPIVLPAGLAVGFLRHTDFAAADPTKGAITEQQIEQIEKKEKWLFGIE